MTTTTPKPTTTKKRGTKKGRRRAALGHDEPHRMCIVCRASKTPDEMLRFARSPDGAVGFDIKGVLPGRGAWVCATASCLEKATDPKQGGFARAFDAAVVFDGKALREQVKTLLVGDVLARLGLLRRQGVLVVGRDEVFRKQASLAFVGLAKDLSDNSRHDVQETLQKADATTKTLPLPPMETLADALGTRVVGVVGVPKGGAAAAVAAAIHKAAAVG